MGDCALITCYNPQGELLLGKRRDNAKFTLPAGHLEEGESPLEAAKRELKEETGLEAESLSPLMTHVLPSGKTLYVYSAFVTGTPHGNNDPDQECEEWKFYDIHKDLQKIAKKLHGPENLEDNVLYKLLHLEKSEELAKSHEGETERLLKHPDPNERLLALKMRGLNGKAVSHAALDPDSRVHEHAINHPLFDHAAAQRVLESDQDHEGNYPIAQKLKVLEKHPSKFHIDSVIKEVTGLGQKNKESAEILRTALAQHPKLDGEQGKKLFDDASTSHTARLALLQHRSATPEMLHGAIHNGLTIPAKEAFQLAQKAIEHSSTNPDTITHLVHLGMEGRDPHVQALAHHALRNSNTVPDALLEKVLQHAKLYPDDHHMGMLASALQNPNSTDVHVSEALKLAHPKAMEAVMGARAVTGKHLNEIQKRLASNTLQKALDAEHFKDIKRALDPSGPGTVDHVPHLTAHPPEMNHEVENYKTKILNSPNKIKKLGKQKDMENGVSKKVLYEARGTDNEPQRFMVKPYHEKNGAWSKHWAKHPIQGWAEMTHQGLYHAAGIGHLHQKVHVSEHNMGDPMHEKEPALVVHVGKGFYPASEGSFLPGAAYPSDWNRVPREAAEGQDAHGDARKIAMMDMLTNNLDRHSGNLMHNDKGQVLAIDHGKSFQYLAPKHAEAKWTPANKRMQTDDRFEDYHSGTGVDAISPWTPSATNSVVRKEERMKAYQPTFDWWGQVGNNVRQEFGKHLQQIKDPEIRDHMQRNFNARADWLDDRAKRGLENFGDDWHEDPIPMYRPGEAAPNETIKKSLNKLLSYFKTKEV